MTPTSILATGIGIALAASTLTVLTIHAPLRRQLAASCPVETTATFWMRAAVTVLYLLPLFIVLVFGLPELTLRDYTLAEIVRRSIAAAAFALATIVIGMGFRLASLRQVNRLRNT